MATLMATGARGGLSRARLMDLGERLAVLAMFASFAARNYQAIFVKGQWANLLLLLSESLVVLFMMLRRPAEQVSQQRGEWAVAFAATVGPLLAAASSSARPLCPPPVGVALLMLGFGLQVFAKLTLRRSFGIVPANRGVKVGGPYHFVRHPMYLGYVTVQIGFLLMSPSLWNLAVYSLSFACQIVRLLAEERLLSRDESYGAFQRAVRWRLLPGVF